MSPRITPRTTDSTITVKTKSGDKKVNPGNWWNSNSKQELCDRLLATTAFLKEQNQYRYRQASLYARLYGNMPLFGFAGTNLSRVGTKSALPTDRPTMSVITSCVDTITSRMTQSRPRPVFLTDNADYKQRSLAKQLNQFILGEFYQTKAYQKGVIALRDACVWGTGVIKVLEDQEKRVSFERRLATQLMYDMNECFLGDPRQIYELQLIDRSVLAETFPQYRSMIQRAEQAYPESGADSEKTVSDQVMVVEAIRLPSGPDANDGMRVIACTAGIVFDKEYTKKKFPYASIDYSPAQVGIWGQGLAERQMGTQNGINQLLITIHNSINIMGVPRVWIEDGSKVVKATISNNIGMIGTYRGTKPIFETVQSNHPELYEQLMRLIQFAYNQEGISELAAVGKKPAGLNSGEAQREYDDIQSDRFSALQKRYSDFYVDLAYLAIDQAVDIAKRDGEYQTIFPNKDGTKEIDLPDAKLLDNPFVIQCFDESSLPREPGARAQRITELMQAGIYTLDEGRRLLGFSDTEQVDKLAVAGEERIYQILDQIVEEGKYTPPDPFIDLATAEKRVVQYYNLYVAAKLEEDRAQMLRDFFSQIQALKSQAASAMAPPQQQVPPANPMPTPQSDILPNVNGAA